MPPNAPSAHEATGRQVVSPEPRGFHARKRRWAEPGCTRRRRSRSPPRTFRCPRGRSSRRRRQRSRTSASPAPRSECLRRACNWRRSANTRAQAALVRRCVEPPTERMISRDRLFGSEPAATAGGDEGERGEQHARAARCVRRRDAAATARRGARVGCGRGRRRGADLRAARVDAVVAGGAGRVAAGLRAGLAPADQDAEARLAPRRSRRRALRTSSGVDRDCPRATAPRPSPRTPSGSDPCRCRRGCRCCA